MSASDLDAEISKKEKEISTAESNFKVPHVLFCLPHCLSMRQPVCPLVRMCLSVWSKLDAVRPPLGCLGVG
jgi:hypothetical protein